MPEYLFKILEVIDAINKFLFGVEVPAGVITFEKGALVFGLFVVSVWGLFHFVAKIRELWLQSIQPIFYDAASKRRAEDRRRFALHVKAQLDRLNALESWQDYRFTELEAEVEAEGRRIAWSPIPSVYTTRRGLRRERSLSMALKRSRERLILLQGKPGSGKSVALRHVADSMAKRASTTRLSSLVIPIYINLKGICREPDMKIDRNLIENFVIEKMTNNDRSVEQFLKTEFERGMHEGTWLFLFDSFDEIPDILGSVEADENIRVYADAIGDFLCGMNKCRGIVASRSFRGPGRLSWPRFSIQPLSRDRRRSLVGRMNLDSDDEKKLLAWLDTANSEISGMTSNPMFLGLVANHIQNNHELPETSHGVFDSYIHHRLERDEDRIFQRYHIKADALRLAAEHIAFAMGAEESLGLNPSRDRLCVAMDRLGLEPKGQKRTVAMDALEYIKLARSETVARGDSQPFTFAHRRFQEYFSTCVLLREPERIDPRKLLTNSRWREALVVMCQTQEKDALAPIIAEAECYLEDAVKWIQKRCRSGDNNSETAFTWPPGLMHLCNILQDGFDRRLQDLPEYIRAKVGWILSDVHERGGILDRKRALDVAGVSPTPILQTFIRGAFQSQSQWLKNSAYNQVARLDTITADIAQSIRDALFNMARNRTLWRERFATTAHLARLDRSAEFLSTLRQFIWVSPISTFIYAALIIVLVSAEMFGFLFLLIILILLRLKNMFGVKDDEASEYGPVTFWVIL